MCSSDLPRNPATADDTAGQLLARRLLALPDDVAGHDLDGGERRHALEGLAAGEGMLWLWVHGFEGIRGGTGQSSEAGYLLGGGLIVVLGDLDLVPESHEKNHRNDRCHDGGEHPEGLPLRHGV